MQLQPLQNAPYQRAPYAPQSNPAKEIDQSDLFTINPETVKNYASKKVKASEQDWLLEKDSSIEGLAGDVGPSHVLKFDVTVTGDGEQTFSTSGDNRIYLADKDGIILLINLNSSISNSRKT